MTPRGAEGETTPSAARAPRRWKSILVTFSVVFPTVELLTRVVAPRLGSLPAILRDVAVVAGMCIVLSYALPLISRPLGQWLAS